MNRGEVWVDILFNAVGLKGTPLHKWVHRRAVTGIDVRDAAFAGDIDALIDLEHCGVEESIYLSASSVEPTNIMSGTRLPVNHHSVDVFTQWRDLMLPSWRMLSQYSSTASLDEFCSRITTSRLTPIEVAPMPVFNIAASLGINIGDAAVVKTGLIWEKQRLSMEVDGTYVGICETNASLPEVTNLNFIKPHLQRRDYVTTNVATNGLLSVVEAENVFHTSLAIPSTLFLSTVSSIVDGRSSTVTDIFKNGSVQEQLSLTLQVIFYVMITSSVLMTFVMTISSMPKAMTDYSAARFLAIKWFIRYGDFILFMIAVMLILPLYTAASLYGSEGDPPFVFYVYAILEILSTAGMAGYFASQYKYVQTTYNVALGHMRWFSWISSRDAVSMFLEAGGHYRKKELYMEWNDSAREALAQAVIPGDEPVVVGSEVIRGYELV